MSTIFRPTQTHAWWYAAAGVVAVVGLVAVLMATVFAGSDSAPGTPGGDIGTGTLNRPGHAYAPPCFAGHPGGGSIELSRSGCRA